MNVATVDGHKERFIKLLHELFQLDKPELDFGLYRIMHAKSDQLSRFIREDLAQAIEEAFAEQGEQQLAAMRQEIEEKRRQAEELGAPDPDSAPAVKQARAAYDVAKREQNASADIYDHLYRFFSRYYDKGDFMSRRHHVAENDSRAAPYAVPYDGREVYLHWANKDQYYVKSSETLANFTFNLNEALKKLQGSAAQAGLGFDSVDVALKVHCRVVDATEGEHNDVKESTERFFIIHHDEPVRLEGADLVLQFEYRPDPEKTGQSGTWQKKRLEEAEEVIMAALRLTDGVAAFREGLATRAPTDKQKERTLLGKYLQQYTARNTMDYFIHKDLGGFLSRELDFYIKNEILRLDDIDNAEVLIVEQQLKKIQVLRKIAKQIITFLAQLEGFQKKLWLKKKFAFGSNYLVTIDSFIEHKEFLEKIVQVRPVRKQWEDLYGLDLDDFDECLKNKGVASLVEEKEYRFLILDTGLLDDDLAAEALSLIHGLDASLDGVLIYSDNFQALRLVGRKLQSGVKTIYIDPPYNTDSSAIPYKNDYKHSAWGTLLQNRLDEAYRLLHDSSVIFVSIDKVERNILEHALDNTFGAGNKIEELIWTQNTSNGQLPTYSTNHEYVEVYAKNKKEVEAQARMFREPKPGFSEVMDLVSVASSEYWSLEEVEEEIRKLYREHISELREEVESRGDSWDDDAKKKDPWKGIYNYKNAEYRDSGGGYVPEDKAKEEGASIWVWREISPSAPASKQAASTKDPGSENYRYYRPVHPVTKKECPHPKGGWKFPRSPDPKNPSRRSFESLEEDFRIAWGEDEKKVPQTKGFLHEVETNISTSVFYEYNDGEKQVSDMFGESGLFLSPKSSKFVKRFVDQSAFEGEFVVDFFGGSGSTANAVIEANKNDGLGRKFLLIEMGAHFESLLKPRVMKSVYSGSWRDGKPTSFNGISQKIKYFRLESYDDTLNNLELDDNHQRDALMEQNPELRRDYTLKYLLDVETRGSASLLNTEWFRDPEGYMLKIKQPGSDETRETAVDLVETFNWLIGLHVTHLDKPRTYIARFKREEDPELPEDQNTRLKAEGLRENEDGAYWIRQVEGHVRRTPGSDEDLAKVLVVWRKLTDDPERDAAVLEALLEKYKIGITDSEFDAIYINGPHGLNLTGSARSRVHSLEETFHARMWEGCGDEL